MDKDERIFKGQCLNLAVKIVIAEKSGGNIYQKIYDTAKALYDRGKVIKYYG